jgi:hypothetical protein
MSPLANLRLLPKIDVRREGLEPPEAEAAAFTAQCNCHYTTDASTKSNTNACF